LIPARIDDLQGGGLKNTFQYQIGINGKH